MKFLLYIKSFKSFILSLPLSLLYLYSRTITTMASRSVTGGGGAFSAIPFPEPKTITIPINGNPVLVVGEDTHITPDIIVKCLSSPKFKKWLMSIDADITVTRIVIQSVDMFGPNVGFIKFKADATFNGKPIPSIVFMRGDAVAILVILTCEGKRWVVCTKQARFPVGSSCFMEIPAGMMDNENNFVGVAAKELAEETGIKITGDKLLLLGDIHPSPGGCDEKIRLFYYEQDVSSEKLAAFQGKCTGNFEEGETITLEIVPYETILKMTDVKAICAKAFYEELKASGGGASV